MGFETKINIFNVSSLINSFNFILKFCILVKNDSEALKYVDIHTHGNWNAEILQIKNFTLSEANTIFENGFYSFGIHPWYILEIDFQSEERKLESKIIQKNCLAIGECGLDKICNIGFSNQMRFFEMQIQLSEKLEKPLILHIVKAFNELMAIRKKSKAQQAWIVHGFGGSVELARQLTDMGLYLSFGHQLKNEFSKASKTIKSIPLNKLFLETDTREVLIEEIYHIAALRIGIEEGELKKQLFSNFLEVFPDQKRKLMS